MWRSGRNGKAPRGRADRNRPRPRRGLGAAALALALALAPGARGEEAQPGYWLKFGKTPRLCPGSKADSPFKIEGASWGILASGVMLCHDTGSAYVLTVDYLNVAIDPAERTLIKRDVAAFDWLGLALYRPGGGEGIDWLFDRSLPVKGELRRDSAGRIVFGKLTFEVPKAKGDQATNMMLYLTFDGPLVAIYVL